MKGGRAAAWGVALAALLAGGFVYGWTLRLAFAYDDVDLLNQSADVLAGRLSWTDVVLRPHGDHLVPVLRLLFLGQASLFGVDALPLRLLVLATHVATAVVLSAVARRYAPGRAASLWTALGYVGTAGLSSQLVWQPVGASTPLAVLAFALALWSVASRPRLGGRRAEALAALALAGGVVCANTLFPLVAGPVLVNERERRRSEGARGLASLTFVALGLAGAVVGTSAWVFYRHLGHAPSLSFAEGIPRAFFLLATAPFRALVPYRSLPGALGSPASFPWAVCLAGLGLLALAIWLAVRWGGNESKALGRVAFLVAAGSAGVALLVGLGRSGVSYADLYYSDRYFHSLAPPLALLLGALGEGVRRRTFAWPRGPRLAVAALLLVGVATHLSLQRLAVHRLVNHRLYAAHARRFASLVRLMDALASAARASPLHVPDGAVAFPDVHNRRVTTRTLLFVVHRNRTPGLGLDGPRVDAADESRLNPLLDAWAEAEGEPRPFLAVREGRLVNLREAGMADFRVDSGDDRVVQGFGPWDGRSRWMGAIAEIRLVAGPPRVRVVLGIPWAAIRAHTPGFAPVDVEASLVDEDEPVRLGRMSVAREGLVSASFAVPAGLLAEHRGRPVVLRLEASRTWRPRDVLPGNPDAREVSVLVYLAGFED